MPSIPLGQISNIGNPLDYCVGDTSTLMCASSDLPLYVQVKSYSGCQTTLFVTGSNAITDVAITKTANKATYQLGESVIYTFNYINTGTTTVTGIFIKDTWPATITLSSSGSLPYSTVSGTSASGYMIEWNLTGFVLQPGQTGQIVITGITTAYGSYINTVAITTTGDAVSTNNTGSVTITVPSPGGCINPPCS